MWHALPPSKRARLSMACNECRRRKVKCDAEYPRCRHCVQRKSECSTTDPKRPNVSVRREWIEERSSIGVHGTTAPADPVANVLDNDEDQVQQNSPDNALELLNTGVKAPSAVMTETSPVHHPYQMAFHADRGAKRIKMMGSSSSQCLIKSLDLYLKMANITAILPSLQYGMRHTEEMVLPLVVSQPPLPSPLATQRYSEVFFDTIHPLWPVFPIDETKEAICALSSRSPEGLSRDDIPTLASAFLVMSLGADELAQRLTADGDKYLEAAGGLLGHVILIPYLEAVQTLILYSIAFRGRNKDGLAWQTIGMAIRIAHSLGLHKHSAIKPSAEHGITLRSQQQFHARIWGICCCIEKMLQLECGRPSSIFSVDNDQLMGDQKPRVGYNFLLWNMGLAGYQSEISQHIYNHRSGERTANDILRDTARLDRQLLEWSTQVPPQFQPENVFFCSNEDFRFGAFLAIQYHQAIISLHRAALIAPRGKFDAEVEKHCPDEPSKYRIKRGELICVSSARAIIRLYLEVTERRAESRIFAASPGLLACVALAIFLMKHPSAKAQAADLELLKVGVEHIYDQFLKCGQDLQMVQGIGSIYEKVRTHLQYVSKSQRKLRQELYANPGQEGITQKRRLDGTCQLTGGVFYARQEQDSIDYSAIDKDARQSKKIATFPSFVQSSGIRQYSADSERISPSGIQCSSDQSLQQTQLFARPELSTDVINGFNVDILQNQDNNGGPDPDMLPFGHYNMEEMWDWMLFMGSGDNLDAGSHQDSL